MNDESNGYQRKEERIDTLSQEAERASKEQDYEKAAQLRDEILRLHELEPQVNHLPNTGQQEKERLNRLIQEAETASEEQDYGKAAQLAEEAERKRFEAEIDFEIGRGNFVRAAMLAEQHQYPLEKARYLQEMALKRYAFEYHNAQGLLQLINWYGFSKTDVVRIMNEGLSEHRVHDGLQSVIVDTMRGITLQQFIDNIVWAKL